MALTLGSVFVRSSAGNKRFHYGTINFDSSYPTGGYTIAPALIGLHTIEHMAVISTSGSDAFYNFSTGNIQVGNHLPNIVVTGGQGAASALQINPDSNAGVLGKTQATTRTIPPDTFGFLSSGKFVETANATNLSGIAARYEALGV